MSEDLGRKAARAHLDAAHRGATYAPLRHAVFANDGRLVRSTAESDDATFAHLPVGHPRAIHEVRGFEIHEADPYAGLDPWSDAARCTDCGHHPQACECPHNCQPAGAER